MYALVDCNNFFVSCERTLDPELEGKPVVVLSNNDGCVVSRSKEAKDLGIPMAAPAFKYKELFQKHDVKSFSAKFELYNYKSQMVINIAKSYVLEHEVYSIDELFLDLTGYKYIDIHEYCLKIKTEIYEKESIPVSIGIAPTKTLCKVANRIVKDFPENFNGVYLLDTPEKIEKALKWLPIEAVWGIGRRLAAKMHDNGVYKAWDLLQKPEMWVRKIMGIHGVRMINELKGIRQLELDTPAPKKSIAVTRSFMEMLTRKEEVRERVETFGMYCSERLRKQNTCCKMITVFVQTNRFRKDLPEYRNAMTRILSNPTNSSILIGRVVNELFEAIYKDGFHYKRAGVIVNDFVPEDQRQISLFEEDIQNQHLPVMRAMDAMNRKYGKDKVRLGSMSGENTFGRAKLSPEYEAFLKNNILPEANFRFH
ncbi:SOS mutagenesis and repair protein UmuC [Chryseobacterium sp. P1-3]|uniref:SOS mutagenesis and repair protein UmuC n=1 Tax=Chryseobacterium gallinarum TaxID=1324352 RepID=A0A0G3M1H9_CHRGL|nr:MULTISPECIES: Y-family DNA polymerase [Chryseobacterium]AKK72729.1 SOS mutagenesis and repair protein UmuC [Chryseobacterium gallinarum]KFF74129.1 SOS mutagenesis and repair protein UmuC [Chryseobacterium sp. P1-3]MCL8536335.1 Y-family DNA polymerase [Chryseobacterium gallinarum]QIY91536.1 Y-family DNA polymerase [Chryseobacterium gallinarum]